MSDTAGHIHHVRVFIDRATVTRRRTVELQPGLHTITFGPLPLDLDPETFRAKAGTATGEAVAVLGITNGVAYRQPQTERAQEVSKALDEVEAKIRASEDAEESDQHAVQLLERYATLATDKLSAEWLDNEPAFDKWIETFEQLRRSHARLTATQGARLAEQQRLDRRRQTLSDEVDRLGRRSSIGHEVTVNLQVAAAGPIDIDLSYVTRKAQWMPAYDARVLEGGEGDQVRLTAIALVRQTTGEDWTDVRLVATTARPPLSEPPPQLQKLEVAGFVAAPDREVVATGKTGPRLAGAGASGGDAAGATVEHEAAGTVSIPSTARPVRVELFSSDVAARRRLEVAPLGRKVAVWVLELENTTQRVLLPGEVSLFRGANYSGRSQLPFIAGRERFRLPMATEGSLRIDRQAHIRPPKKAAVTGKQIREYETQTTIENLGAEAIELVVKDRIPASRSEHVQIEQAKLPEDARLDDETGRYEVTVQLPAHATRKLQVSYRITAPRGFNLHAPSQV